MVTGGITKLKGGQMVDTTEIYKLKTIGFAAFISENTISTWERIPSKMLSPRGAMSLQALDRTIFMFGMLKIFHSYKTKFLHYNQNYF